MAPAQPYFSGRVSAEQPQRAHFAKNLRIDLFFLIGFDNAGQRVFLRVVARGVANEPLVFAQLRFEMEWVFPFERGGVALTACILDVAAAARTTALKGVSMAGRRRLFKRHRRRGALALAGLVGMLRAMGGPSEKVPAEPSALANLNARSRDIFRRIVDSYLATGEPVGSRHLSRLLPISLSPASVRNVMQDLEELGLIYAPHTSAGRHADRTWPALFRRRASGVWRSDQRRAHADR